MIARELVTESGTRLASSLARPEGAEDTFRVTVQRAADVMEMRLEGRVAGPWAEELNRVWVETASRSVPKKLTIDVENVTYADARGKQVLRGIYAQTKVKLVASIPWTQFLAAEVADNSAVALEGDRICRQRMK
jgi:hypothetical protein